jgi:periplasmic copper chaperone A
MTILAWLGSQAAGPGFRPSGGALLLAVLCALVGGLAAGTTAWAAEPGLTVSDPWLRLVLPSRPAAGYLTLANATDKALVLVGAASPACGSIMLHRSVQENGQERMEMVMSVTVPARGSVTFAPGGYHLMCMTPAQEMTPGRSVPVTLRFADGGTVVTSFAVRGATGK